MEPQHFNAAEVWEKLGITEHLGGFHASQRLIESCRIMSDHYVLDIGCGTGYTACLLARQYNARVVAADISGRVLEYARERIQHQSSGDRVMLV
jgi:cyclopropane fatty-acyl-phospholipid synthase-like methyltransferase